MEDVLENGEASESDVRIVETEINYLQPGPEINRRFVSAGQEVNTGIYGPHPVQIRDGRLVRDRITLDRHGFRLADHKSAVVDFFDNDEVARTYPGEVAEAVKTLTGASFVATMNWMVRTSGDMAAYRRPDGPYQHAGGVQPPANEAHIDTIPEKADGAARAAYNRHRPAGSGYHRFIYMSFWRAFSEPPQDWPLAMCESGSVRADEGVPNTLLIVDRIPEGDALFAPIPGEEKAPAAAVLRHNPDHRWWYFSEMTRDEAILLKFHDSDRRLAWRTPHTAFKDPSFAHANTRASIEYRVIAYFE